MYIPVLTDLLDLFFPRECPGCRKLLMLDGPGAAAPDPSRTPLCPDCLLALARIRLEPAPVTILEIPVLSAFVYDHPLDRIIPAAKSKNQPRLFRMLTGSMGAALVEAGLNAWPGVIVPVPLHPARRRERGYDQARCLADTLGRIMEVSVERHGLKRIRATPPQKMETRTRRLESLHGAFEPGRGSARLAGKRVLLVDDVVTTGATLAEAVRALRLSSPGGVLCLTMARTLERRRGS